MRHMRLAITLAALAGLALAWAAPAATDLLVEQSVYDAGARVRSSVTVVDLEGDGLQEIVFGTDGGEVVAMTPDGVPKWISPGMAAITVPPATADILPEPGLELVVGDWRGRIWCLSAAGRVLWQTRIGDLINWSSPAILGVTKPGLRANGGPPLIIVGDETGGLCALSAQGKLVWRYRPPKGAVVACPPAIGDVNGDGVEEIVFGAGDGMIRCLNRKGQELWTFKTGGDAYTGPVIADLEGDKRVEVVTASGDGFAYALDGRSGAVVWKFNSGAAVDSSMAVADILPAPGMEVVFANDDGRFYCLSARGEQIWAAKLDYRTVVPPCIADLNSDGALELTIGDHRSKLYVFSADGKLLEKHELTGRVNATPAVIALPEGLGLVVPDESGKVRVFLAPQSTPQAEVAWSGFRDDPANRGDVRVAAAPRRLPIRIISADPGALLMGAGVFGVKVENDSHDEAVVKLEVNAPEGRTFVSERRQRKGEGSYEMGYEILAGGQYRFGVSVTSANSKARPVLWERTVHVTPFARDMAELTRLLGQAQDAAARLTAADAQGARHVTTAIGAISNDMAGPDLARYDTLGQAEQRRTAERVRALIDRASRLAANARFAAAACEKGQRDFAAWSAQPYAAFDSDAVPESPSVATLAVTLCRNEKHPIALNIFNFRNEQLPLRILAGDLKADGGDTVAPAQQALTLRRVVFAPSTNGRLYADALPQLDVINNISVTPWEAAQLWIGVDAGGLAPGVYRGEITLDPITPGIETVKMPLEITVRRIALEGRSPLASCQWAYLDAGTTADKMQEAADDLLAHYTTVFPFVGASAVPPNADAEGNLLAPLDFTAHDALFNMYHRPKGWLLYLTGSPQLSGALEMFSPAWEKLCATWLKAMAAHAQSLGLDYKDWAWYPIDEAGREQIPNLLRAAKFAKSVDPRIQMYYDFFQGPVEVRLDDLKQLAPYIDIWQPHRGIVEEQIPEDVTRMDFLRSTGKQVWIYDTAGGSHSLSPCGYYRSQGWLAWQKRINGVGFWTYNTTATDQWQAGNEQEYLVIYQGREIVPSKRWEAYRDGIEDYWVMLLLRQAGERARAAGRTDLADQAESAISSAVAAVMADKDNPQLYETQRRIIADLTEQILAALPL